jgi:uncharacterized integral membrane protein (TIGR00698 family)
VLIGAARQAPRDAHYIGRATKHIFLTGIGTSERRLVSTAAGIDDGGMPAHAVPLRVVTLPQRAAQYGAGLTAVGLVVAAGFWCHHAIPSASPALCGMGFGMLAGPLVRSLPVTSAGVELAATHLLRVGVALLGLRISVGEVAGVGFAGLAAAVAVVVSTMLFTIWLGCRLRIDRKLAVLVAAGSAVCGASAIAAVNDAIGGREEQVGYAVATVTVFGTASMLLLAPVSAKLGLSDAQAGIWAGASIHEVAQATAAGAAVSAGALKVATLVKLTRVIMLAGVVAAVSARAGGSGAVAMPRVPSFVIAFLVLVVVGSVVPLPPTVLDAATQASNVLLAAGLGALGLRIRVTALRRAGLRPFALGAAAAAAAAVAALGVITVVT